MTAVDARPCRCWTSPAYLHGDHCCFLHAPDDCHENVLDAADQTTGSRDATLSLDSAAKRQLVGEVIDRLYPRPEVKEAP